MAARALIEHRPWLVGALSAAIAYYSLRSGSHNEWAILVLKGCAVGCLAAYAWRRGRGFNASLLTAVMVCAAIADMVVEKDLISGGGVFLISNSLAIILYLRNRRNVLAGSQKLAAAMMVLFIPIIAWLLTQNIGVTLYSIILGAMAGAAWTSVFSRYRVGIGAVLFVISDLLIFWNFGSDAGEAAAGLFVWPCYFVGQLLIATAIVQQSRKALAAK
ncbi:MAG: lysoplasmalogenase family protein [Pontixanthobacter sp.]